MNIGDPSEADARMKNAPSDQRAHRRLPCAARARCGAFADELRDAGGEGGGSYTAFT